MSKKWTHAIVSCFGCNSYSLSNFYVRKGQEVTVTDKSIADDLRVVPTLNVVDFFEDEVIEELPTTTKSKKSKKSKKGK